MVINDQHVPVAVAHHVPVTVDLVREAVEVSRRARRLTAQVDAVNRRRREIIAALILSGLHQTEVARLLDLSRQRITQYVEELRASGQLPAAGDDGAELDEDDGA